MKYSFQFSNVFFTGYHNTFDHISILSLPTFCFHDCFVALLIAFNLIYGLAHLASPIHFNVAKTNPTPLFLQRFEQYSSVIKA